MVRIKIAEHYEARTVVLRQERERANSRREHLRAQLKQTEDRIAETQSRLKRKEAFRQQAIENGVDAAPVTRQLKQLEEELSGLVAKQATLKTQSNEPDPPWAFGPNTMGRAAKHLEESGCSEAERVSTLAEVFQTIAIFKEDLQPDVDGRPASLHVRFGDWTSATIKIAADKAHYVRSFRPKELDWLPTLPAEEVLETKPNNETHHRMRAIIIADRDWLVVSSPITLRHVDKDYYGRELASRTERIEDSAIVTMEALVKPAIEEAGGVLHLDQEYPANSLMSVLQGRVLEHTTDTCRWAAAERRQTSDAILKTIARDWGLLAAAPWSGSIDRTWAKLKYTVENGERPRFWCNHHADHYGYRIRTRDHTWIAGELFVDQTQTSGEPGAPLESMNLSARSYSSSGVRRLGRLYLTVREFRDEVG